MLFRSERLKYIQDQKLTEGIQHKLLIKLLGYNFTIEYKQGKKNKVADALSRVQYKYTHSLPILSSLLGSLKSQPATYHRVKLLFHWPSMKQFIVDFIKQCPTCQINKPKHYKYPGLLQPLPVPDFAWCHISMDFV